MMRPRFGPRLALWTVALALLAGACGSPSFQRSEAIDFVAPLRDIAVPQPVTLDWEVAPELQARIDSGEVILGVFVDRTPISPGESLLDLADDDCRETTGCPDAEWLADRGVYATKGSALALEGLSDRRTSRTSRAVDRHEAVIVLLDPAGKRVDEQYWSLSFLVDRGGR